MISMAWSAHRLETIILEIWTKKIQQKTYLTMSNTKYSPILFFIQVYTNTNENVDRIIILCLHCIIIIIIQNSFKSREMMTIFKKKQFALILSRWKNNDNNNEAICNCFFLREWFFF